MAMIKSCGYFKSIIFQKEKKKNGSSDILKQYTTTKPNSRTSILSLSFFLSILKNQFKREKEEIITYQSIPLRS